ncbi:hypothetical protein FNH06_09590 [Amycolatopsis acidiphila]|uniref:Uncharacterized protein n=1 Tax=Amycolatopsis acidiphila TaxID=715473 RepID=A0A558AGY1_9PSEU|nr:hypothetical protein FNH06_09590 [Amycolatopsis acidiphila]
MVDIFSLLEPIVLAHPETNPWQVRGAGPAVYDADFKLLEEMLTVPVAEGTGTQSGRLAKTIDAWVARELRRSGFDEDEVWPRLSAPRVVPREVSQFIKMLPRRLQSEARMQLLRNTTVAPSDARILGRAYVKQVDVLIAQWSRGPELLVSTKSMGSSFRKNLANRFEEAYGDAKNLRGRYPLAAMGFLFLLRSTIQEEAGAFERAVDMMRKLKAESDVYDATCLVVAEWHEGMKPAKVTLLNDLVPEDLNANTFMATLVDAVLTRTPVEMHVEVRQRREHRVLPIE